MTQPSVRDLVHAIRKSTRAAATAARWAAFGVAAVLGLGVWALTRTPSADSVRWEYRVESFSDTDWKFSSGEPNALGRQGWEIIAARRAGSASYDMKYECILRRRVP